MFTLTRFGTTNLPNAQVANDMGSLATVRTAVAAAGGATYDTYGTADAPVGSTVLVHRGFLVADTPAELETAYRALLARRGQLDKLYRTWDSSNASEWVYARLARVGAQYNFDRHGRLVRGVDMFFENRSPCWNGRARGGGWTLDSGYNFDTGRFLDQYEVYTITGSGHSVINGGDTAVTNIEMKIDPGGSNVTAIEYKWVRGVGDKVTLWSWSGTLTAGNNQLFVDTETRTVKKYDISAGTYSDEYSNFTLGASNPWESWVQLDPGETDFEMIITGGTSPTVIYYFYDGHS